MSQNITRRRLLIGTGTVAAGSLAYAHTADNASAKAAVAVDELTIPDSDHTLAGASMKDVRVAVTADWSYTSNVDITDWELRLRVGSAASTADVIARAEPESDIGNTDLTGTTELVGSVLESGAFELSQFNPESGERSTSAVVVVEFDVFRYGELVAQAQAETEVSVTVTREEVTVEASVDADGAIEYETTTPTATETPTE